MSTNKSIARSAGIIGLATSLSRLLGLIRDMVIAGFFGTAIYAQAFVVAFRIPNLLRDLVGEGAMNAAFVPVLTEELTKKGRVAFFKLAQVVLNILCVALIVLTIIGIWASPTIARLIAPGFVADTEKFKITITLTRILFPFLMLVGLWAYTMGLLNTLSHFAAPAFGPCILNLSMILCAMWFGENVFGLTTGVLVGGVLQLLVQFPPLYLRGWKARLTAEFKHPKAKRIGILLIPRALASCVYQINLFISTILASLPIAGDGTVAALYFANRVWQLPLAIFGIALAQAALPTMSRQVALNDMQNLKNTLLFSLRTLFFILLPSTIGLMVLHIPITRLLFEHGRFNIYSTQITSNALFFYAVGLIACGGIKMLVNVFYSLQDTLTPVKVAMMSVVVNIILNLLLIARLKAGGLALATSLAAIFNCILLYFLLRGRIGSLGVRQISGSLLKISLAAWLWGSYVIMLH
ncbi:MAG: murein biosynthesis integral membrane protein MurJ [Candidatus Omnitrophica bacterium]|nr:murein biosynthesis integral membrane protein MurJ [Candidatus Omnitrophota bacterium]